MVHLLVLDRCAIVLYSIECFDDYDDYDYDLNAKGVSTLSNSGVPKPETGSSVCFSAAPDVWTNAELRL